MTDDEITAKLIQEMEGKSGPMEVMLQPSTAMGLVALVQLAMRHPDVPPKTRDMGLRFVAAASDYFADCPSTLEVIQRGADPSESPAGQSQPRYPLE